MNLFFALTLWTTFGWHNFHVSITNGELNPESGTLQVYMKLFVDDLENNLSENQKKRLNLGKPNEYPKVDSLLSDLVLSHFWIKNKGQKLPFQFIGKELEQDIIFIYLEVPLKAEVKELTVSNTIFFDRFEDQSNIVNIEVNGRLESAFLEKSTPVKTLGFD